MCCLPLGCVLRKCAASRVWLGVAAGVLNHTTKYLQGQLQGESDLCGCKT